MECDLELFERAIADDVAPRDVAKFEECGNCLDHIGRDESLDSVQIDL